MIWIYFSPHCDDIAFSCGGLVWEQQRLGHAIQIWTIFAGDVPAGPLSPFAETLQPCHEIGLNIPVARRAEDLAACQKMNATPRHFGHPDCIYRRSPTENLHLYSSPDAIFGPLHPTDETLIDRLATDLDALIPSDATLVCPLALGGHVDHRITRAALERTDRTLWYYPDYPYVLDESRQLDILRHAGWQSTNFPVSESGLEAWISAVAAYPSQVSLFWQDLSDMHADLRDYWQFLGGGVCLWTGLGR